MGGIETLQEAFMRTFGIAAAVLAALSAHALSASAAVISFSDVVSAGWQGTQVAASYAPPELAGTGIAMSWTNLWAGYMGGSDQGGDGRYVQTLNSTAEVAEIQFSSPVYVPSLFVDGEWGVGVTVKVYTNVADTTPVGTFSFADDSGRGSNSPAVWHNVTTFVDMPIQKLTIQGGQGWAAGFADSITVTSVPEPASLATLSLGSAAVLLRRRRALA
jgi:PEP-CTERM motif